MIFASIAIFLLLASMDEYESVVAPFFKGKSVESEVISIPSNDDINAFIQNFNVLLSQVYLSSNPVRVDILPAHESVKRDIADEIDFLVRNSKIMLITVDDIKVEGVEKFPPITFRVKTSELVSISYLNLADRTVDIQKQVAKHQMIYTIEIREGEWEMVRFETVGVEGLKIE